VFHDLNSARASERLQPEELRNKLQEWLHFRLRRWIRICP